MPRKLLKGPKGELRPDDPVGSAVTTAKILTGELTEEEVRKDELPSGENPVEHEEPEEPRSPV